MNGAAGYEEDGYDKQESPELELIQESRKGSK
jgi:hypothetical protein